MRQDQFMGLNEWAQTFIRDHSPLVKTFTRKRYPSGLILESETEAIEPQKEKYGSYLGMFSNEYDLNEYTLNYKQKVREYVQASPWSSGPVFFLALKWMLDEGKELVIEESLWSEEEMNDA